MERHFSFGLILYIAKEQTSCGWFFSHMIVSRYPPRFDTCELKSSSNSESNRVFVSLTAAWSSEESDSGELAFTSTWKTTCGFSFFSFLLAGAAAVAASFEAFETNVTAVAVEAVDESGASSSSTDLSSSCSGFCRSSANRRRFNSAARSSSTIASPRPQLPPTWPTKLALRNTTVVAAFSPTSELRSSSSSSSGFFSQIVSGRISASSNSDGSRPSRARSSTPSAIRFSVSCGKNRPD
mmetsp:Transcript_4926/g.12297  ORF Transcript_4926/g.12297 Transcript_4926/m.12297 type:complete len:239 (+) Transcript_4926:2921-3637(+)